MAVNTGKKRVATKWIRDRVKSNYKKDCKCAICSTEQELEFHHFKTVSLLLKNYAYKNSIPISTDDEVLAMRDDFISSHWQELVEYAATLCNNHHKMLHKIYGREPSLSSAAKQERWVEKQSDKFKGIVPKSKKTSFASLI